MGDNHNAIQIDIDTSGLEKAAEHLKHIQGGAQVAIKAALNTTAYSIRTNAGKEVFRAFAVKSQETATKRMFVKKATESNLTATVERRGPRFFAKDFPFDPNTSPGRRGGKAVFLRPRRDGSGWSLDAERNLSKAFVATLPSRGGGIYRRIGNHRNRLTHARGLSVPDMLGDADVRRAVESAASQRLNKEVDIQIRKILAQGEVTT